ncbi:MAG: molybdate ABC transporter substrate-binding protein [Sarcina sp.]
MKKILTVFSAMISVFLFVGCIGNNKTERKEEINLSAASSLYKPLEEIKKVYEEKNKNISLNINYGSSGTLQKQIEQGAEVDLFISASKRNTDELISKKIINEYSVSKLLSNGLVLARNKDSKEINSIEDLKKVEGIIGLVENGVPLGEYSKKALEDNGILEEISKKAIYAKDAISLLNYLELGEVDYGIIFTNQLKEAKNLIGIEEIKKESYGEIAYTMAILNKKEEVQKIKEFLSGEEGKTIFKNYGFEILK